MEEKRKVKIKIKKKITTPSQSSDVNQNLEEKKDITPTETKQTLENKSVQENVGKSSEIQHPGKQFRESRYNRDSVKGYQREFRERRAFYNREQDNRRESKDQRDQRRNGLQFRDKNQGRPNYKQGQQSTGKFAIKDKFAKKQTTVRPQTQQIPQVSKKQTVKYLKKEVEEFEIPEESFEAKLDAEFSKHRKQKVYAVPEEIEIYDVITVGDLAKKMNVKASDLIEVLEKLGLSVTINDKIDSDTATIVAEEFGTKVIVKSVFDEINVQEEPDNPQNIKERPPIVTVMGHVDHGKTTLLDTIRNTRVAMSESGGITQHIGASVVEINGKKITFIDTPGHEAFTYMRAKGAKVTDIVILVVAADDGVKEQTIEALNHAKDAKVPIVVAINKIDSPGANPDRVKNQLSELGLIPDDWGGDTIYVEVSALKKINIDKLLEAVSLQAELMELKADYKKRGVGFVIESKVDQGRGIVFTLIVKNGVVKVGDNFVVGTTYGKVRAIFDDKGNKIKELLPGLPGEIVGAEELPNAGEKFNVVESEDQAKEISEKRKYYSKIENIKSLKSGRDIFSEVKEIKYIVKGDVFGSVEAIKYSLEKLSNEEISIKVIHFGVGQVNESDVMLASAGGASIIAFKTKVLPKASEIAEREKVKIKKYNIIYEIVDDVKKEMKGLKEPVLVEKVLGSAEVRKVFKISGVGSVAGCYVKNGVIQRKSKVRIYRDNILVYDGEISSLKHLKDDVSEVKEGLECGIAFKNFNDIKEGDVIECYKMVEEE
ncbi:MAG: translation initiation factor IF-2 [Brevinematales bacterium]|nr:translation initiation factor IF-2 [Brevinematales bacterium]